jgi:hypothetical protein
VEPLVIDWLVLGDVGAEVEVVLDDVEVSGIQVDVTDSDVSALESIAVNHDRSCVSLEQVAIGEIVQTFVRQGTVGRERITYLECDTKGKLLASLGFLTEAGEFVPGLVQAEEVVYQGAFSCAFSDGHPAELRLSTVNRKGDDAHPQEAWRVAKVLESAAEHFVDFPISLLTFKAAVVHVLAAGAEFAGLGTDSTLITS